MKLYPPAIEGKLPAFAGSSVQVPFKVNRAVSMTQVGNMKLHLKTVKTNQSLGVFEGFWSYNEVTGNYSAVFDLKHANVELNRGQYYKVQIAFMDVNTQEIGYYSSVGVIKYTSYPIIEIPSLTDNYYGNYEYIGIYKQPKGDPHYDPTEKVYSYCFELKDSDGNIISTTGTQIHNSSNDTESDSSSDSWSVRKNLKEGVPYYITYKVTTTNGLECESQSYIIIAQESVDSDLAKRCTLIATLNNDDGYIQLALRPKITHAVLNGSFVLARASSEDNFDSWNEIYRFSYKNIHAYADIAESGNLITQHPDFWSQNDLLLWKDFTIQQGVEYIYSIQAYNAKGLYSNKMINQKWELDYIDKDLDSSGNYKEPDGYDDRLKAYYFKEVDDVITADFEDMFLFDGTRQLKIRFNPKVSSFKATVLESKMDTLGGKYPFVFRNGNVEYKEFPVAGLLSLISDPNELFLKGIQTKKLLYRSEATGNEIIGPGDTHVTMDNIRRERQFKMEALSWLTNGQPKLFRSPGEGNFIVRIMNVSMSPLDVVGRMLHSFSGTAYEIAEPNFDNLNKFGFTAAPDRDNRDLKVGSIQLANPTGDFTVGENVIYTPPLYQAYLTYVQPGTLIAINFADGLGNIEIEIGTTGAYYVQTKDKAISSITLLRAGNDTIYDRRNGKKPTIKDWEDARLDFCYYDSKPTDNFNLISKLTVQDEFRQFIGVPHGENLMDLLEDKRRETGRFHYIRIHERHQQTVYHTYKGWSRTPEGTDIIREEFDWNPATIYLWDGKTHPAGYNSLEDENFPYPITHYFDGHYEKEIPKPTYQFQLNDSGIIQMDGRKLPEEIKKNLSKHESWLPETLGRMDGLTGIDRVSNLQIDTGLILEIAYRVKIKEYAVEDENAAIQNAKEYWQDCIARWNEVISKDGSSREDIQRALEKIETAYEMYIYQLIQALSNVEKEE